MKTATIGLALCLLAVSLIPGAMAGDEELNIPPHPCMNHPDGYWGTIGCLLGRGLNDLCESLFGDDCKVKGI